MPAANGTAPEKDEKVRVQTESQNPLLSVIGAFANDPDYDALMEDVYEYRRQLDAQEQDAKESDAESSRVSS